MEIQNGDYVKVTRLVDNISAIYRVSDGLYIVEPDDEFISDWLCGDNWQKRFDEFVSDNNISKPSRHYDVVKLTQSEITDLQLKLL